MKLKPFKSTNKKLNIHKLVSKTKIIPRTNYSEIRLLPHQFKFITSKSKTTVLLGGRGCGKTTSAVYLISLFLVYGYSGIVTAQTYKLLKINIMKEVVTFLRRCGCQFTFNKTDQIVTMTNGAVLCGFSAENSQVDTLRGPSNLKFLVMDEAALADKHFFATVIACLRGRDITLPRIYLLTTPKGGRNWVSEIVKSGKCALIKATTMDNTYLASDYVQTLKSFYSDSFVQQEIYAQINEEDSIDQVIPSTQLYEAFNRLIDKPFDKSKRIIGIDLARYGNDEVVIYYRDAYKIRKYASLSGNKKETFIIFDYVKKLSPNPKNCILNVDGTGGFASGITDVARKFGYTVNEINFSEASPDKHYANMRTYLYFKFLEYLPLLGIEKSDKLENEVLATKYLINNKNQIALISKDEIKKVLQCSPDDADALVLTCYSPLIVPFNFGSEESSNSVDTIMNEDY